MTPVSRVAASSSPLQTTNGERIVSELLDAAGPAPVTKIDMTKSSVAVTTQSGQAPTTWTWENGKISSSRTQSAQTASTPFDPASFALGEVPKILATAARVSGSQSNQDLQIVEYNSGTVLISVSTKPESRPVFFRADGSLIASLDFTTLAGMTEGLSDATSGLTQVSSITYDPTHGIVVDSPTETPGIVMRRTRSADLPAWSAQRKGSTDLKLFSPTDVKASVLVDLLSQAPTLMGHPADAAKATLTIDMSHERSLPTITVDLDGVQMVTDMTGKDITSQVK